MQSASIIELLIRVLCDTPPSTTTDGVFLFGQTSDNQEAVFITAQQLLDASLARKVLFVQTGPISGFPGFDAWKKLLNQQGIGDMQIEGITGVNSPILHTLIEAEALVQFAKEKGYRSLFVVASPFQQLRAYMTAVTVAVREYPELKLYSRPGVALPWLEQVVHSQGTTAGSRKDLIQGELERIDKYNQKGDLDSVELVLNYLNKRDSIGQ
jgi:hypothetical protein